jgi:hypothetical protein
MATARVGHHSNSPFAPHSVSRKSTHPVRGSNRHPPEAVSYTTTGHFGQATGAISGCYHSGAYIQTEALPRIFAGLGLEPAIPAQHLRRMRTTRAMPNDSYSLAAVVERAGSAKIAHLIETEASDGRRNPTLVGPHLRRSRSERRETKTDRGCAKRGDGARPFAREDPTRMRRICVARHSPVKRGGHRVGLS